MRIDVLKHNISEAEDLLGKNAGSFGVPELISILQKTSVSAATFKDWKYDLRSYLIEHYGENARSVIALSRLHYQDIPVDLTRKYWKNFYTLRNYIILTVNATGTKNMGTYDTAVACIYLAWYGVPYQVAPDILKDNVSKTENIVWLPGQDTAIEVGDHAMDFLREYASHDQYDVFAKGGYIRIRNYCDSPYLLRTWRKPYLSPDNISVNIRNFEVAGETQVSFEYSNVFMSGVFARLHMMEVQGVELPNIVRKKRPPQEHVDLWERLLPRKYPNRHALFKVITEYFNWKRCFYPNE